MNPLGMIKFIGCWFCIVACIVMLVLSHTAFAPIIVPLAVLAIAFAQAPTTW